MEDDILTAFMKALFEAGFDVQVILAKGFDFAVRRLPGMDIGEAWLTASREVLRVAQYLCIDREAQFRESRDAWKQEMVDRALRLGLTIGGNADAS